MAILKKTEIGFQDQLLLNAGHKYCRMLQGEHSAILSTFIKLPFVSKTLVLSILEWSFYTGFTVLLNMYYYRNNLLLITCLCQLFDIKFLCPALTCCSCCQNENLDLGKILRHFMHGYCGENEGKMLTLCV